MGLAAAGRNAGELGAEGCVIRGSFGLTGKKRGTQNARIIRRRFITSLNSTPPAFQLASVRTAVGLAGGLR